MGESQSCSWIFLIGQVCCCHVASTAIQGLPRILFHPLAPCGLVVSLGCLLNSVLYGMRKIFNRPTQYNASLYELTAGVETKKEHVSMDEWLVCSFGDKFVHMWGKGKRSEIEKGGVGASSSARTASPQTISTLLMKKRRFS